MQLQICCQVVMSANLGIASRTAEHPKNPTQAKQSQHPPSILFLI